MNATPTPDGRPDTHERAACGTQTPPGSGSRRGPRQKGGARETERLRGATADLLEHPAAHTAAQAAAVENLLRCWVRENNLPAPTDGTLRIPLPASGTSLLTPVHHWSPTGWHRFGLPHLADAPEEHRRRRRHRRGAARAPSGDEQADDSTAEVTSTPVSETGTAGDGADLLGRVADSVRRTVVFINDRRERPADTPDFFLAAEQALVLGHPWHPTPKSREGLSDAEARLYSPELRGSFPLHWMAVARGPGGRLGVDGARPTRPRAADHRAAGGSRAVPARRVHRPAAAPLAAGRRPAPTRDRGPARRRTAPGPRPARLRLASDLLRPHPLPLRRPSDAQAVAGPAHHQLPP